MVFRDGMWADPVSMAIPCCLSMCDFFVCGSYRQRRGFRRIRCLWLPPVTMPRVMEVILMVITEGTMFSQVVR